MDTSYAFQPYVVPDYRNRTAAQTYDRKLWKEHIGNKKEHHCSTEHLHVNDALKFFLMETAAWFFTFCEKKGLRSQQVVLITRRIRHWSIAAPQLPALTLLSLFIHINISAHSCSRVRQLICSFSGRGRWLDSYVLLTICSLSPFLKVRSDAVRDS